MPCCIKHAGQNVWPLLVSSSPLQVGQVVVMGFILANVGWTFLSDGFTYTTVRPVRGFRDGQECPSCFRCAVKRPRPYCSEFRAGLLSEEEFPGERYVLFENFLRRKVLVK